MSVTDEFKMSDERVTALMLPLYYEALRLLTAIIQVVVKCWAEDEQRKADEHMDYAHHWRER